MEERWPEMNVFCDNVFYSIIDIYIKKRNGNIIFAYRMATTWKWQLAEHLQFTAISAK